MSDACSRGLRRQQLLNRPLPSTAETTETSMRKLIAAAIRRTDQSIVTL
jgi:hypothetical protein